MAQVQVLSDNRSTESEIIRRAVQKDEAAVRAIIQANNQRLYRVARSIVRDDSEAEDVLQEAYLCAFSALSEFRGESSLATWLTRIVLNEALQWVRRRTEVAVSQTDALQLQEAQVIPFPLSGSQPADPERAIIRRQLCQLLESAIDELPEKFRTVLVARTIEGMSTEETAELLGLRPETVKTRLHRARQQLKAALPERTDALLGDVFAFAGKRCHRFTNAVVKRVSLSV